MDHGPGLNRISESTRREGFHHVTDRQGRPKSRFRKFLRQIIHFLSYHLILGRPKTRTSCAAGFRLTVYPTVFHPRFFISSERFAKFIDCLDLKDKSVADVGTGSGILALAAARAGAAQVTALDINPNAVFATRENAKANGFANCVTAVWSDLFSAIPPVPTFDVIVSSPPKHAGEPRDLADAGWHAGEGYRHVAALFDQSRKRLKSSGRMYVMVSSDTDLVLFGELIAKAGFRSRVVQEYSIFIESFIIYELVPQ